MRGPELGVAFLYIELLSCGFHEFQVKETSNLSSDRSIKSEMLSTIDSYIKYVLRGSKIILSVISLI